jgi:hypothetical protein
MGHAFGILLLAAAQACDALGPSVDMELRTAAPADHGRRLKRQDRLWLLCRQHFDGPTDSFGSPCAGRARDLTAEELTVNLSHQIPDVHGRQWSTLT